jgi:putative transposase
MENNDKFTPPDEIHPLALQICKLIDNDFIKKYEFLKTQLDIVVKKHGKRYRFNEQERCRLVKAGIPVKEFLDELCLAFQPSTLLRWHREQKKKKWDYSANRKMRPGRPRTGKETEQLVLNMVENNITSPRNIAGELQKLGHEISHTTVFKILNSHGLSTDPDRKAQSWKQFIQGRMELIWATDFFTEEVWTFTGLATIYVLFFIHLKTRRVYVMGCTPHPDAGWMKQQARNFLMMLEDTDEKCRYLIHDHDSSFLPFDHIIKTENIKPVKTPKQSPWCNGYAERFVREARETLDNLILIGEHELLTAMKKIERYHNYQRPHQGLDNRVPLEFVYPEVPANIDDVQCRSELGGLLTYYYVDKAA